MSLDIHDPGEVHLSATSAVVRLPHTTRHVHAQVLGVWPVGGGQVSVYLDRLVHRASISSIGGYSVSGGVTTILTGRAPLSVASTDPARADTITALPAISDPS